MKRMFMLWLLVLSTLLGGCSRDDDVNTFMGKLDGFTSEIVTRVETAKDRKAGVDAAQSYFDQNKAEIQTAYADIKNVRGFQVKEETMKKLADRMLTNGTKVAGLKLKLMGETMKDDELDKKLDKLEKSYEGLFSGG